MALVASELISGQQATATCTYCYMYEPLRVLIAETNLDARKLYIKLIVRETNAFSTIVDSIDNYGDYDINPGEGITLDLAKLMQQYHDANLYRYASMNGIADNSTGWHSVVSRYKYEFQFTTSVTAASKSNSKTATDTPSFLKIIKLPIIGGRSLPDFVASVTEDTPLTEAELYGFDLEDRWKDYSVINNALADPDQEDSSPSIQASVATEGEDPCGGVVHWKSRFGGWMTWGFKIKTEMSSSKYTGTLEVGMFESTWEQRTSSQNKTDDSGQPYVPVDYTGLSSNYRISLKALGLSNEE